MASSTLRSAGRVLRQSIPQGTCRMSPISYFAGRPYPSKYSTSSLVLDSDLDELLRATRALHNQVERLEKALDEKDAIDRRLARQRPFEMLACAMVSFALGFYTNQHVSA